MKMIHTADLHLDSALNTNLDREKAKERKNELLMCWVRMVEYAHENDVSAILIAGDLFDKKVISAHASRTVLEMINKYPDIAFYYLKGNHDDSSFINSCDRLPDNLFMFSDKWTEYVLFENKDRRAVLTGAELTPENSAHIYDSLVLRPQDLNIVTLHGQLEAHASKDRAETIDLRALGNKNIAYLALGHVHEYREGELAGSGIYCYPGCLEGRGYDEPGEHGFVLLDIDEDEMSVKREFVPFAKRRIWVFRVDVSGCMSAMEMTEPIRAAAEGRARPDDMVKIELCGDVDVDCEKNTGFIERYFGDGFYAFKVKDLTGMKIDYRDFAKDTSLKGEFVRLMESETGISEEEKMAVIRCGLQVLGRESIEY